MKVLTKVIAVRHTMLLVSLPNMLLGHVPITNISAVYSERIGRVEEEAEAGILDGRDSDADSLHEQPGVESLSEMFKVGQFIPAVITRVRTHSTNNRSGERSGAGLERLCQRIELSVEPSSVNSGLTSDGLPAGLVIPAAVQSIEDNGYVLDLGIPDLSGFLSFKEAPQNDSGNPVLPSGAVIMATVTNTPKNGRTCTMSSRSNSVVNSCVYDVPSIHHILPGILIQGLITAASPHGITVKLLGSFDGTLDAFHDGNSEGAAKIGSKVRARVIYRSSVAGVTRFALSTLPSVLNLDAEQRVTEQFPVGTVFDGVKISGVEGDWGVLVDIDHASHTRGFVHISELSDDHVSTVSSTTGLYRLGTCHRARVTGFHSFDNILQLTFKQSVIDRKYLQVSDVEVGEVVTGRVKKLTDAALFVTISAGVDGVVWPRHFADIILRQPQKRFRPGAPIKCRVLTVEPSTNRITLTAQRSIVDSKLPIIQNIPDAVVGDTAHGTVYKILEKGVLVEFYNHVKAFLPCQELREQSSQNQSIEELYPIGKPVKVKIMGVFPEKQRIIASIRRANTAHTGDDFDIGQKVHGEVIDIHKEHLLISIKPSGAKALLSLKDLAKDRATSVDQLIASVKIGEPINDLLIASRNSLTDLLIVRMSGTLKASILTGQDKTLTFQSVVEGQFVAGRVIASTRRSAVVRLSKVLTGRLHPTDTLDDFHVGDAFPAPQSMVRAQVVELDNNTSQVVLSTRPSRLNATDSPIAIDPEISSLQDLVVGRTLRGFVKSITDHGIFVTIGRDLDARIQIKELFDGYVKDWQPRFRQGQIVDGRILSIDMELQRIEMSLRKVPSETHGAQYSLAELKEGQIVTGVVKRVQDYGVFIQIAGTSISGLCHKSEISDREDADVASLLQPFHEGESVTAIILSIDPKLNRVSFGLRPSYFHNSTPLRPSDGEPAEATDHEMAWSAKLEFTSSETDSAVEPQEASDNESSASSSFQISDAQATAHPQSRTTGYTSQTPRELTFADHFQWSSSQMELNANNPKQGDLPNYNAEMKRPPKRQIEADLTAEMHTKPPESAIDFERLLLGSPNSSYLWIQYASFLLQLSELDKARKVLGDALQTIHFREEKEKFNIWMSLLNIENSYGTEETLHATLRDAARANDAKTVYLRLASIFEQSSKHMMAEDTYEKATRKFGTSCKVWTLFGEFQFRQRKLDEARSLLSRSLQVLEPRKHVKIIVKFAQMEFKYGTAERGRTVFEGVIESHPKRLDLWMVYIDLEASQCDLFRMRALFERLLQRRLSVHKAKSVFKKWLEAERRLSDEAGAQVVMQKAIDWKLSHGIMA